MSEESRAAIMAAYADAGLMVSDEQIDEAEERGHTLWLRLNALTDPPDPAYLAHDDAGCEVCARIRVRTVKEGR